MRAVILQSDTWSKLEIHKISVSPLCVSEQAALASQWYPQNHHPDPHKLADGQESVYSSAEVSCKPHEMSRDCILDSARLLLS